MKKKNEIFKAPQGGENLHEQLRRIVSLAVFAALTYVIMIFVKFPVPPFLTLDIKDSVITVAAILYGAYVGPLLALIVSLLEMVTVSETGFYGFLMNFAGSACFSFLAALWIRKKNTRSGFLFGLPLAVPVMTLVMIFLNLIVTPLYYGVDRQAVIAMIPTVFLPFNLAKGILNAVLAVLLYPPVSVGLRRAHLVADVPSFGKLSKKETAIFAAVTLLSCVGAGCLLLLLYT